MRMRKNIFTVIIYLLVVTAMTAQQQRQFTHFMFNKMAYNPAYVGNQEAAAITGLYRNQWVGINGAPISQFLTVDLPFRNNKVGLGFNLAHSTIGISNIWNLDAMYAYRIKVGAQGGLAGGIMASGRYFGMNFSDPSLIASQNPAQDPALQTEPYKKYIFNFGAGIYFNVPHFYLGVSVPRILEADIDFDKSQGTISKEERHYYLMTGIGIDLSDKVEMIPQVMVKYIENAPWDLDANVNFVFNKKITIGGSYRMGGDNQSKGESLDFLLGFRISRPLYLGVSYDYTISSLQKLNRGSYEAMLRYIFIKQDEDLLRNPRFF